MIEIIITIIVIVGSIANARYDADLIKDGKHIKHGIRALIRFILIVGLSYLIYPETWLQWGLMVAVCCAWFWIVFDAALNVMLGRDVFSIGSTAFTDRMLSKLGNYYAMFLKLALLLMFMFFYILHYDNLKI